MKLLVAIVLLIVEWHHSKVKSRNPFADTWNKIKTSPSLRTDMIYFTLEQTGTMFIIFSFLTFNIPDLLRNYRSHLSPFMPISELNVGTIPAFLIALLFVDFARFFAHWVTHQSDWLWIFHKTHHAPHELNMFTAERGHPVDNFFKTIIAIPLYFIFGFDPHIFGLALLTHEIYTLCHHVNYKIPLGPLEYVFTTPQYHRMHHRSECTYQNLGGILTLWDVLFRCANFSFKKSDPFLLEIGVRNEAYPQTFTQSLIRPFQDVFTKIKSNFKNS